MTPTFIPEGSGSLVLPGLGYCPEGSSVFRMYTFLPPLWSSPISPIEIRSNQTSTETLFFTYRLRDMRRPKWLGDSLNFQFTGIIIVTSGGIISPSGTKIPRLLAGHKVMETASKNFPSGSLVRCTIPISTCQGKPCSSLLCFFPVSPLLLIKTTSLLVTKYMGCFFLSPTSNSLLHTPTGHPII